MVIDVYTEPIPSLQKLSFVFLWWSYRRTGLKRGPYTTRLLRRSPLKPEKRSTTSRVQP